MNNINRQTGSFRDPSGFVFFSESSLYRCIKQTYKEHYDALISSGLYDELTKNNLLVPHKEIINEDFEEKDVYKIIEPDFVDFISYPYEWTFSQLKTAALTTLEIQKRALLRGMILKDCSAYNIQFLRGRPVLIDTLSFSIYKDGQPWDGYLQCCKHFLAPLALMAYTDVRLQELLRVNIDGIPLDLASRLLPKKTFFSFSLLTHIHLHARSQNKYSDRVDKKTNTFQIDKEKLLIFINNLISTIQKLEYKISKTEWGEYYANTNYTSDAFDTKKKIIEGFLDIANPKSVWDMGANTGLFSRVASGRGIMTTAFDNDPVAVEKSVQMVNKNKEECILPLIMDLSNPSPSLGWNHAERDSMKQRGKPDMIFALALVHHLVISNNIPLSLVFSFFVSMADYLIIEFVPKSDSQVQKLLATREDIFDEYQQESFEKVSSEYFSIVEKKQIPNSERTLYLMKKYV